ncbi:hypothetical protein [Nocardia sp. NPDC003345]
MTTALPRGVRRHARAYRALWLWARGGTDIDGTGYRPLPAARGTLALPMAFGAATLVEVGVLHLLIPWAWLSITLAVVSGWSLLLLLAMFAADISYPHYVTEHTLVLRRAGRRVATVPLDRITAVAERRRYNHTATVLDGDRLFLAGPDGTTVDVTLSEPVEVRVNSLLPGGRISAAVARFSLCLAVPLATAVVAPPDRSGRAPRTG